jgi:hypothetical protein
MYAFGLLLVVGVKFYPTTTTESSEGIVRWRAQVEAEG